MATNACAVLSEPRASLEAVQDALRKLSAGRREYEEFLTELCDRWGDLREQCALLERERSMLQAQLEAAARHHGKLAAALAAQQRRNARLQLRWTGELRRLRRLLEGGAGPVAKQPPAGEPLQLTAAAAVDDGPQVVLGAMS